MVQEFVHRPVMVSEVVGLFEPVPPGVVIDSTVGGGGHAAALLAALPQIRVVGLDRDPDAVLAARRALEAFGDRATVVHARFGTIAHQAAEVVTVAGTEGNTASEAGGARLSGVLFDLGVSSPQIDRAERGFSYRNPGPLDMRMDPSSGVSALEVVNETSEDELAALFAAHGEARAARRIARAVVQSRPFATTTELAEAVDRAVPARVRRRGHPAARVFQAIRVAVNDELGELEAALPDALAALAVGGRCVTVAYHSGEDRLVKRVFDRAVRGGCTCPPGLPCVCGAVAEHQLVFRGSRKPSAEEIGHNRRAASARLRAIERIAPPR
jgi:16S rRNA (cytosine1402-N4)-methyltransferase